jgi:hypothetical protein
MAGVEEVSGVTIPEAMDLLSGCSAKGTGCFASDPEAYLAMQGRFPDYGDGLATRRMVDAATEAGMAGVSLDEASFTTWQLVPDEAAISAALAEHPHRDPGHQSKIVDGLQARVVDNLGSETAPDDMRPRIVRCAYLCGKAGVGNCPVLLGITSQD